MATEHLDAKSGDSVKKRCRKESPIRTLREFFSLERDEFSELANISPWTLRDWEIGVRRPRPEGWRRLRNAFVACGMKQGMSRKKAFEFVAERLVRIPGDKS